MASEIQPWGGSDSEIGDSLTSLMTCEQHLELIRVAEKELQLQYKNGTISLYELEQKAEYLEQCRADLNEKIWRLHEDINDPYFPPTPTQRMRRSIHRFLFQ